jgi:5-methyltetrahydrofolate--homocysteine methyltransferase
MVPTTDPRHRRELGADLIGSVGPDHAVARRDDRRRQGDDAPRHDPAAVDRRRHHLGQAHRGQDRAGVRRSDGPRARCLARGRRAGQVARRRSRDVPRRHRRPSRPPPASSSHVSSSSAGRCSRSSTARARRARLDFATCRSPAVPRRRATVEVDDRRAGAKWIDWSPFFHTWELSGRYPAILDDPKKGDAARKLFADAKALLAQLIDEQAAAPPAASTASSRQLVDGDDLVYAARRTTVIRTVPMLRQQEDKTPCLSLADFIAPLGQANARSRRRVRGHRRPRPRRGRRAVREADHDDYHGDHGQGARRPPGRGVRRVPAPPRADVDWGYGADEQLITAELLDEKYRGIRPAFGYPACPDHGPKQHAVRRCSATRLPPSR